MIILGLIQNVSVYFCISKHLLHNNIIYLEEEESVELKLLFLTNEIACLMNPPPQAPIVPTATVNKKWLS